MENRYWISHSSFQATRAHCYPLYLIRPSLWLRSPERVLILHPYVHLRSLLPGPSFTPNYILCCYNISQATDGSTARHGHGASHSPFLTTVFLHVSSTVWLQLVYQEGSSMDLSLPALEKVQASGNALSWGACNPSVSIHMVLSHMLHPQQNCGLEGQLLHKAFLFYLFLFE